MTIPRMAQQLGLGERQVRRLIASLKENGRSGVKAPTNSAAGL